MSCLIQSHQKSVVGIGLSIARRVACDIIYYHVHINLQPRSPKLRRKTRVTTEYIIMHNKLDYCIHPVKKESRII